MEEIGVAKLLSNIIGGRIKLLTESTIDGEKMPDYLWNNKLWELKNISTKTSVDGQIRKAIKQIFKNPGGIILKLKNNNLDEKEIISFALKRLSRVSKVIDKIDIILIENKNVLKIYRIKK